ncbi:uncharacterized protein LOC124110472 [Haliotis rufescens]|uniref:uncharacterized protein LOC124110472 n=1 Tax=Haliotis rufescens TaxID=6454 RepID=UPI00201F8FAA|nr:uncharacterized protein LOC124110472 [Haliotis rufescens]
MNPESDWNWPVCPKCSKPYHMKTHLKFCHPTSSEANITNMHLSARQEIVHFKNCRMITENTVVEAATEVGFELDALPKVVALLKHFGHHISKETVTTTSKGSPEAIESRSEEEQITSDTNLNHVTPRDSTSPIPPEEHHLEQSTRTRGSKPDEERGGTRATKRSSNQCEDHSAEKSTTSRCFNQGPSNRGPSSNNPPSETIMDEESPLSHAEDLVINGPEDDDADINLRKKLKRSFLYKAFPYNEPVMQSFKSYLCQFKKHSARHAVRVVARVSRYFFYMQKKAFGEVWPSKFTLKVLKHRNDSATYIQELFDAGISLDVVRRYLGSLKLFMDFLETLSEGMQVARDLRYFRASINKVIQDVRNGRRKTVLDSTEDKGDLSVVRQGYTSSEVKQEVHRIIQTAKDVDLSIWSESTLGLSILERRLVMRYIACGIIQLGLFHRPCVPVAMKLSDFEGARNVGDRYIIVVYETSSILCLDLEEYNLFKDYRKYIRGTLQEDSNPQMSSFFRLPNGQPLANPLKECSRFQAFFGIVRCLARDGERLGYTAVNARNALKSIMTNEVYRHPDFNLISTYIDHCEKFKSLGTEKDVLKIRFILDQITAASLKKSNNLYSFSAPVSLPFKTCLLRKVCTPTVSVDEEKEISESSTSPRQSAQPTDSSGDEQTPLSSPLRSDLILGNSDKPEKSPNMEEDFQESFLPMLLSDDEGETQDLSSPLIKYVGVVKKDPELFTISTDSSDDMEESQNLYTHPLRTDKTSGTGQPTNTSDSDEHYFQKTSTPCMSPGGEEEKTEASSPLIKYIGPEEQIPELFSLPTDLTDSEDHISWPFGRPEDSVDDEKPMTSDSIESKDCFRKISSPDHRDSPEMFSPDLANSEDAEENAGHSVRTDCVDGYSNDSAILNLKIDVSSDGDDESEPSPPPPKRGRMIGNRQVEDKTSEGLPVPSITGLRAKFCEEFPLRPYGPVPSVKAVTGFLRDHGVTKDVVQAAYAGNYTTMWRVKQRELVVYLTLMQWPRKPSLEEAKQLLKELNVKLLPSRVLSLYDDFRRNLKCSSLS